MATAEEKWQAHVDSLSRDEMLDRLKDDVDSWDLCSLIDYAKEKMREAYEQCTDEELKGEYMSAFDCDAWDYDDDEEEEKPETCQCLMAHILNPDIGHDDNCPEYGV